MENMTATIQERVKPYADMIEVSSTDGNVHMYVELETKAEKIKVRMSFRDPILQSD
ncbi:hypothetical protein EMIT07CA2_50350 [Brevibacillus sp. IT-7CA2]